MRTSSSRKNGVRSLLWRLFRAVAVGYGLVVVIAMAMESRLVYPVHTIPPGNWLGPGIEHSEVAFRAADGTELSGWFFDHPAPRAYVVYCHGNAVDVANLAPRMDALRSRLHIAVFAFDYRGYGQSGGHPNERGLIDDGCAAQRWLAQHAGLEPADIVLWGRSLGGGVTVQVAAQQGARALVLERTFSSMVDVAAYHDPWLPVRLLMRNRFDSIRAINRFHGPLFQAHGSADEVVPVALARRLFAAATHAHPKQLLILPNVTHNGPAPQNFFRALSAFVAELP